MKILAITLIGFTALTGFAQAEDGLEATASGSGQYEILLNQKWHTETEEERIEREREERDPVDSGREVQLDQLKGPYEILLNQKWRAETEEERTEREREESQAAKPELRNPTYDELRYGSDGLPAFCHNPKRAETYHAKWIERNCAPKTSHSRLIEFGTDGKPAFCKMVDPEKAYGDLMHLCRKSPKKLKLPSYCKRVMLKNGEALDCGYPDRK